MQWSVKRDGGWVCSVRHGCRGGLPVFARCDAWNPYQIGRERVSGDASPRPSSGTSTRADGGRGPSPRPAVASASIALACLSLHASPASSAGRWVRSSRFGPGVGAVLSCVTVATWASCRGGFARHVSGAQLGSLVVFRAWPNPGRADGVSRAARLAPRSAVGGFVFYCTRRRPGPHLRTGARAGGAPTSGRWARRWARRVLGFDPLSSSTRPSAASPAGTSPGQRVERSPRVSGHSGEWDAGLGAGVRHNRQPAQSPRDRAKKTLRFGEGSQGSLRAPNYTYGWS